MQDITLDFDYNFSGKNPGNLKLLAKEMKNIPYNLQSLTLSLMFNSLGKNQENMKWVKKVMS